jgi:hypothetical protein
MAMEIEPTTCSKCGSSQVRVLWGWGHLRGKTLADVKAGRAILGSRLASVHGPANACLACAPGWNDVHRLAFQEYELQDAKAAAVADADFELAARLLHMQDVKEKELAPLAEKLTGRRLEVGRSRRGGTGGRYQGG